MYELLVIKDLILPKPLKKFSLYDIAFIKKQNDHYFTKQGILALSTKSMPLFSV
ncbi:hypothetical protein BN424_3148 [Carnobacterium maltaromaticum LMA28]|uniref:Uncharacterized protein n=1 Tax=Carnobacterium maltaromaticum LMA28 TaxID=1234679 RepID=K8E6V9_CARML|nr:hypothetical protein BN424_3148 [Carnobacterium maltaromaticum LMA28]